MFGKKSKKVELPTNPQPVKADRSLDEITKEYSTLCARLGQAHYNVHAINKDIEFLSNNIRDLNFEAARVKAKNDTDAAALAASKADLDRSTAKPVEGTA